MREQRGKTLVRVLASMKLDCLVGVQTYPYGDDDWNVMLAPDQIVDVVKLGFKLHFHGFSCLYGPVEVPPGQPPHNEFVFQDNLPQMLPDADKVEEVGPDDMNRMSLYGEHGEVIGWSTASGFVPKSDRTYDFEADIRAAQEAQKKARTGGERIWSPGDR